MIAVFTIASRNHLHRIRVLMASVRERFPDARRFAILVDPIDGKFDPAQEDFTLIAGASLGRPDYRRLAFALDPMSLCCALKPVGAEFLMRVHGATTVLYIDADMQLYARPDALLRVLEQHPVALSPHVVSAERNARMDQSTMRSGPYNGGLFAVTATPGGRAFLAWWISNGTVPENLQVPWSHDQGWLAHVPALFPEATVFRDPSYNVAFWNLHEREVTRSDQTYLVNGAPLTLFHFSHFDRRRPTALTGQVQTAFPPANAAVQELLAAYASRLAAAGADECEAWGYGFGRFSDGKAITPSHRAYFDRRIAAHLPADADPFSATLEVPGFTGLKSLYHADHPATRWLRTLRRKPGSR